MRGKNLVKLLKAVDLLGRPQGATIKELEKELSISRRSVYRLLDLIYELGIPVYNDEEERPHRWKILDTYTKKLPNLTIPDIRLTLSELIALYLFSSHKHIYAGTEIEKHIDSAFAKLNAFLPDELTKKVEKIKTLFIPTSKFTKDYSGKDEIIDKLRDAMLQQKTCVVRYHSFSKNASIHLKIDPLSFFEYNHGLYTLVRSSRYDSILTLAVERFEEVALTEETFEYPQDLNIEEQLAHAFGIVLDEPLKAKIWFSSGQAMYIKERTWTKKQKIIDMEDGSIVVELNTSGIDDVKRWVLSYGAEAEVLEPRELREDIRKEFESAVQRYKKVQ